MKSACGTLCILFVVTWMTGNASSPQSREEGDTSLGRLPTNLWPIHYTLELKPDFYDEEPPFYFNGSVDITFEVRSPTYAIYLNNWMLSIDESSLFIVMDPSSPVPGPDPIWQKTEYDENLEFYKIFLDSDLLQDAIYRISMNFSGEVLPPTEQYGLFYTTYQSIIDGTTKYQLITQLQSTAARRMFPSFDEPMFKATFDITLLRQSHVVALSNGNLISSKDRGDGWIADTFNTTVKMSVYLVCIAIGQFDYLESTSQHGMPIRVWARPEYVQDLQFANSLAAPIHDFYENYTGIVDPMPKLDHIAVPGFNVGAMENWGLIPYGEFYLLYNDSVNTLHDQRKIANVIGHETAHLWFGDLVTCRWWTEIWLNEGFATFYANLPFDEVWDISSDDDAIVGDIRGMLEDDSRNTSEPVRSVVRTPWENTYTSSTYPKGAAVLRMLRQILGADTLKRGIQRYLNRFAYDVTETDDFWEVMTEQAEIDGVLDTDGSKLYIKEKMDPWIDQRGSPLVTVKRMAPGSAEVTQTQFLSPAEQITPPSQFMYEWYVPLTLTSQETPDWSTETKDWLNRENKTITKGIPDSMEHWFVANVNQDGFFRIKYDNSTYFQLIRQLNANASVISRLSRFSILNDVFAEVRSTLEQEVYAMEATRFLDQETTYVVWDAADINLGRSSLLVARYPGTWSVFQDYMLSKVNPIYTQFGWDDTGSNNFERSLRALMIDLACNYGNLDCILEARNRFATLIENPAVNHLPIDQRLPVYCTAVDTGTQQDWDALYNIYQDLKDSLLRDMSDELDRILTSLACSQDDAILRRYINLTYDPNQIRLADVNTAFNGLASSSRGRWVLWEHFNDTWDNEPVASGGSKWNHFQRIVEGFVTDDDFDELESFIETHPPSNDNEADQYNKARQTVRRNNEWAKNNQKDLEQWLQDHVKERNTDKAAVGNHHGFRMMLSKITDVKRRQSLSPWFNNYKYILH